MFETTIAIVIGNGFDKDLGLPSSYPEFAKSDEWKNLYNSFWGYRFGNWFMDGSLLWHLKNSIKPNWFEIEEEIHNFIVAHPKVSPQQEKKISAEFEGLKRALFNYLARVSTNFKSNDDRLAYQLLSQLPTFPVPITEISFNYTDPDLFLKVRPEFASVFHCSRTYVHGSLKDNNIVLGCNVTNNDFVNDSLSFMYKYNMLKEQNHITKSLTEARDIIFFGHSINDMDFCYFRDFFKLISSPQKKLRYLTFITWDDKSERVIKNNITRQGISVTGFHNNLFSISFIHSSKIYNGDNEELEKWKNLMFRLKTDQRREIML